MLSLGRKIEGGLVIDRRTFLAAALAAGLILRPTQIRANPRTYYVDPSHPNANDSNPGTSEDAPWVTFGKAMGPIPVAGDTVYFKTATYDAGAGTFQPTNSGTPGNPIAFRRFPGHAPRCTRTLAAGPFAGDVSPFIGLRGNYQTFDGFTFLNASGIVGLAGATGNIIENCTFDMTGVVLADPVGQNTSPINLNAGDGGPPMTNWIIRNNKVGGAPAPPTTSINPCSIFLLNCSGFLIQNNELYGGAVWIALKRRNQNHVIEKNWMHDATNAGIIHGTTGTPESNNVFRYNVLYNNAGADAALRFIGDASSSDMQVYNNTIYQGKNVGVLWAESITGANKACYNNIIVMNPTGFNSHFSFYGVATAMLIDYNDYFGTAGPLAQFHTALFGTNLTFAQWRATTPPGPDAHSITSNPLFVGPTDGTNVNGFKLPAGSPARNAGRVGGVVAGAPVNMGAFLTDTDIIGVPPSAAGSTEGNIPRTNKRRRLAWAP